MTATTPAILLENVTKTYNERPVVDNLSLSIPPGEFFAFLGPNGAGKTTTIKMLTGLLRPSNGRVMVAGHEMTANSPEARRCLSYVPDQPYLYEKLSGRDFLQFMRDIYGLSGPDVEARTEDLIGRFNMTEFIDDLAETYSHGMRQRLVFAAALVHDPQVMIVDEPMVGLDPKSVRILKNLLRDSVRRGMTIFMSTHLLSIAEELADRIGIIFRGKMVRCGPIAELRQAGATDQSLEDFFLQVTDEAAV